MSKDSWWSGGERRDDVIPDNVRPQRARKNTKRWCKGKVGRDHTPEVVRHHYYAAPLFADKPCHWQEHWSYRAGERIKLRDTRWSCYHAIKCTTCGKYLEQWPPKDMCPDWKGER